MGKKQKRNIGELKTTIVYGPMLSSRGAARGAARLALDWYTVLTGMGNYEIDKLTTLKISRPHVMSFASGNQQRDLASKSAVPSGQFCRIVLQRYEHIAISMDVEYWNASLGESCEASNRIVLA